MATWKPYQLWVPHHLPTVIILVLNIGWNSDHSCSHTEIPPKKIFLCPLRINKSNSYLSWHQVGVLHPGSWSVLQNTNGNSLLDAAHNSRVKMCRCLESRFKTWAEKLSPVMEMSTGGTKNAVVHKGTISFLQACRPHTLTLKLSTKTGQTCCREIIYDLICRCYRCLLFLRSKHFWQTFFGKALSGKLN